MVKDVESEIDAILEDLRQDALAIAEHYNDAVCQHANYPTMHVRSNMNGVFGEAEKKLRELLQDAQITGANKLHRALLKEMDDHQDWTVSQADIISFFETWKAELQHPKDDKQT